MSPRSSVYLQRVNLGPVKDGLQDRPQFKLNLSLEARNFEEGITSDLVSIIQCCYWIIFVESESFERDRVVIVLCGIAKGDRGRVELIEAAIASVDACRPYGFMQVMDT